MISVEGDTGSCSEVGGFHTAKFPEHMDRIIAGCLAVGNGSGKNLAAVFTKNAVRVDAVPYLILNKCNLYCKYVLPSAKRH